MTLFDRIASVMGGARRVDGSARGEVDSDDQRSAEVQEWIRFAGTAPTADLEASLEQACRHVSPEEYYEHIMPGVRGTDPLGELGKPALALLARTLLRSASEGGSEWVGIIPGVLATDPNRMSPPEVAALANYLRQRDPDAFSRAAIEVGRTHPSLLRSLLGSKALMFGATVLAAKVMSERGRRSA